MTKEQMVKAIEGTKFQADLGKSLNLNGNKTSMAYWNLIVSIRDCKLYSGGIKSNRHWKISDVKWYFGVKGNAVEIAKTLEAYKNVLVG